MNNNQTNPIFRWIAVGGLTLPVALFFLPYASAMGISVSGFDQLKGMFKSFGGFANGLVTFLTMVGFALFCRHSDRDKGNGHNIYDSGLCRCQRIFTAFGRIRDQHKGT